MYPSSFAPLAATTRILALVLLGFAAACSSASMPADARVDATASDGANCATVGCAAPPLCSTGCTAACGCCPCAEGSVTTMETTSYLCQGGCYVPIVDAGVHGDGGEGANCDSEAQCEPGLLCCYPCGIEGCHDQCTRPADGGMCPLRA